MANVMNEKMPGMILIITDGAYHKSFYPFSIKNKKVKVLTFKDAGNAVKDCQVDLILLDCTVDIEEGLNILRNNKSICPHIPNIFITDINSEGLILKIFRSGARDFFRKPFSVFELKNTVEALLALKKASKEIRFPHLNVGNQF